MNAARENQAMIQKQIRILENRLDKALVKFNEALAHNKKLRDTIDDLRRERVVFDSIYRKLEKELHEKKKQMANIIELSNLSYEQVPPLVLACVGPCGPRPPTACTLTSPLPSLFSWAA